jgi:hypothetical protein
MLAFVTLLALHAPYIMTVLEYKYTTTVASTSGTKRTVSRLASNKEKIQLKQYG